MSVGSHESPEQQAVRSLYGEMLRSWNKRDARGFAALFSETGRFVGFDGCEAVGRFSIELEIARLFEQGPPRPYIGLVRDVRMLGSDVALVSAAAGMYLPGGYRVDPSVNTLQTLVVVRERGRWRVASYQCTPALFRDRPELAHKLTLDLDRALVRSAAATTRR